MGMVFMCILWQLAKLLFLGTLREAEIERLNELIWREIMEILFAITIFRQDFSVTTLAMVTTLLMIKSLHWLAQKRVDHIETSPSVSLLSHIRIASFLVFLLVLDFVFLHRPLKSFLRTRKASVALFFLFEYTILASTTISTLVKYIFYVTDMIMEGQWEKKAAFTFYLELIRDLFNLSLYILFFFVIFAHYGLPLHLIRELYETFRSFRIRIADYIRYRKVTSNVDERFPNATPEELNGNDATCIICREEMVTAKKLHCGHLFHVNCLRSWLERQNNCPTCRALVIPPQNGTGGSGQQGGSNGASTSSQGSEDRHLSPHQARLKAASSAASVYEKSFVYSPKGASIGSPGYSFTSHGNIPATNIAFSPGSNGSTEGSSTSGLLKPIQNSDTLISSPVPGSNVTDSHSTDDDPNHKVSMLKARETFIQSQLELLGNELQALQKQKEDEAKACSGDADRAVVDVKGKAIVDPASNSTASI